MECIHVDIKTHLDERDINNLEDAATTADDFALTHKLSANNMGGPNKFNQYDKGNSHRPNQNKYNSQESTTEGNPRSGPSGQGNKDPSSAKPKSGDDFQTTVTCYFRKQPGHVKFECYHWLVKQKATSQPSVPTGCAVSMRSGVRCKGSSSGNIGFQSLWVSVWANSLRSLKTSERKMAEWWNWHEPFWIMFPNANIGLTEQVKVLGGIWERPKLKWKVVW